MSRDTSERLKAIAKRLSMKPMKYTLPNGSQGERIIPVTQGDVIEMALTVFENEVASIHELEAQDTDPPLNA